MSIKCLTIKLLFLLFVFDDITSAGNTTINYLKYSKNDSEIIEYEDDEDSSIASTSFPDIYPDPEKLNRKVAQLVPENISNKKDIGNVDLKEHDVIDNIMYIYYGSNNNLKNNTGFSLVILGSIIALSAQILCCAFMILRNRLIRRQNALFTVFLHFIIILLLSNLIFVLGVQGTQNEFRCGMVAILLHYCHLVTAVWGLIYVYIIYDYLSNNCGINLKYNYLVAYGGPAIFVLLSCSISSKNYEIIDYCWMSVHRGMILNFMIPVLAIMMTSTMIGMMCLKEIEPKQREYIAESIENMLDNAAKCHEINSGSVIDTEKCCEVEEKNKSKGCRKSEISIVDLSLQSSTDTQDFSEFKRAVKFFIFFQPAFAVCWFFGAMALENRESFLAQIIFAVCYNILNWYLLVQSSRICPIIPDQNYKEKLHVSTINHEGQQLSSYGDTIPLLCTPAVLNIGIKRTSNIVEDCLNDANFGSHWTGSIGDVSCNFDSISTISN